MSGIDLSSLVKTKSDAEDFSEEAGAIGQRIYETNFNLDKVLLQTLGSERKDKFYTLMRNQNIDPADLSGLQKFIDTLRQTISALPVLNITLSFEPTEHTLEVLQSWFLMNMKQQVLFDVKIDHKLIAGITVNFKGRHFQDSIKERISVIVQKALDGIERPPQPKAPEGPPVNLAVENMSI